MRLPRLICAALTALTLTGAAQADSRWDVPDMAAPLLPLTDRLDLDPIADLQGALTRALTLFDWMTQSEPTIEDRVLMLNLDPRAAFTLVQRLQSLPYGGQLRDPAAVLAGGGGNAHDKAATLADLLGRMGYDTRLVTGAAPSPPVATTCRVGEVVPEDWRLTGLGQAVLARLPVRAAASYRLLQPALAPVAQAAPDTGPHVWVQVREGADWVDLDPWAPDTPWGDHPGGIGDPLADPPAPQAVVVTLTREVLRDGALSRDTILEERLVMTGAAQSMVALSFGPVQTGIGAAQTSILAEVVDGSADMVARLIVNGRTVESSAFAVPGVPAAGFLGAEGGEITTGLWLTVTSLVPGAADHSGTAA